MGMSSEPRAPEPMAAPSPSGVPSKTGDGLWGAIEDQFALRQLVSEYMIPVETNVV